MLDDDPPREVSVIAEPEVRLVETHSAVLVFIGDRVYKLKKPVDLGFLDFSSIDGRRRACQREIELNRRLSPDVYLGAATVHAPDDTPCEYLVVMRRMPAERRLTRCLERGEDVTDQLRQVAHKVAALHEASPAAAEMALVGSAASVRRVWDDGFGQTAPCADSVFDTSDIDTAERLVHRYIDGRSTLFADRVARGWIRDGHGDLQADDIFLLDDGPRILDCIEFSDTLRWGDALGDVAFLVMDLERLGRRDLADQFLSWHREFTADNWPSSLAHHYIAQRAFVRAKVMAIRYAQGDDSARTAANGFLQLALRHLDEGRVALVLVGGLPGTGKSTVATGIIDHREMTVLGTDELRGRSLVNTCAPRTPYGENRYAPAAVAANYNSLLGRAERLLRLGESVVLDASWSNEATRKQARAIATATSSDLVELMCVTPPTVAAARIVARGVRGEDPSEATPAVAAQMATRFNAWPEAAIIRTDRPIDAVVGEALAAIDRSLERLGLCAYSRR